MKKTEILIGPPGTGKTQTLLNEIETLLRQGLAPERIGFVSFTNRAADEAVERAVRKFDFGEERFPWFRTLHSAAYRQSKLRRSHVMTTEHFKDLGDKLGLSFQNTYEFGMERAPMGGGLGDRLLRAYSLARARLREPSEEWDMSDDHEVHRWSVIRFAKQLESFKVRHGLVDFCDMLDMATAPLPVDVLIIDEAQDLTPAQWALARRFGRDCKRVIIAGDDDQAIYEWAGADPSYLRKFKGEYTVLPESHRVPRQVYELAQGISSRIQNRVPKKWSPRSEEGSVEWLPTWKDDLDLSEGTWLLLARHRRQLGSLIQLCKREGVVYWAGGRWSYDEPHVRAVRAYEALRKGHTVGGKDARLIAQYAPGAVEVEEAATYRDLFPHGDAKDWMSTLTALSLDDFEYIRAALRRGESLSKPGRVRVSTIHSVKGAEADNVLLLTSTNRRVRQSLRTDSERRVWYVGATRARARLVLAGPAAPVST